MNQRPESSDELPAPPQSFRSTQWSAVLAAREPDAPEAARALERLCAAYWYPLYAFVRRSGRAPEDAADITQEFFARMIAKQYFGLADPAKGRFRTFLLCALKRFLADDWDRQQAQKRGAGVKPISLDEGCGEERYRREPADNLTPEVFYERQWAQALLAEVLRRLQAEHASAGKAAQYDLLKVFITGDKGELRFAEAGARLGLSESAVKAVVHRLRQRYCEVVRETVSDTVQDPQEIDGELRHLLIVLEG